MKYIGSVLLSLGWCFTLFAGEAVTRAGSGPVQPQILARSPLPRNPADSFETWSLRMQDDFFRLRIGNRSARLPAYMSDRAFEDPSAAAMFADDRPFDSAAFDRLQRSAFATARQAGSFDLRRWFGSLEGAALADIARQPTDLSAPRWPDWPAVQLLRPEWASTVRWPGTSGVTLQRSFDLNDLAGDFLRRLDPIAPPDWNRWRLDADRTVTAGADRLHGWLQDPATARQIDRWRAQADGVFDFIEGLNPDTAREELDRLLERLDPAGLDLPAPWAERLAAIPAYAEAAPQLRAAIDRFLIGATTDPRYFAALESLRDLRRRLDGQSTETLLFELDSQVTRWQNQWPNVADRLQAELPTDPIDPGIWLAPALEGGLNLRIRLPATPAWDPHETVESLTGPTNATADALTGLTADWTRQADGLLQTGVDRLQSLTLSTADDIKRLSGTLGGLDLSIDRLQLQKDFVAADRIEFGLDGTRFRLDGGFFGQAGNDFGGRDSFLMLGAADLSLADGDYARFQDVRFQLRTAADFFQVAASVNDLQLRLNRQNWAFDAIHVALQGDNAGLRLRGIVYPHDPTGRQASGVYFEAATRDLQVFGLYDRVQQAIQAQDLGALAELFASRPKLFGNDFLVAFNGRAARMLENQYAGRLDGGTRLLIGALSGFDDGYRTVAIRGDQVARIRELAAARQYSMLVEQAREIVPEIAILYSHYLRRFGGRPDSMAHPVPVLQFGGLEGVIGAAEGSYATQWFGGLACPLPGSRPMFRHRLLAGWLYEQAGVGDARMGDPTVLYPQYSYERAGFLQYRYNGWALAYENRLRPTLELAPGRRVALSTLLNLGLRRADNLSFANESQFAAPREFLARYDQPSPIGNVFPIFHAESTLQFEWSAAAQAGAMGVGCDADFGYGSVARGLGLQLPLAPELTPKAYFIFDRPFYRLQLLGAWPTAADQVPYAACQMTWDLNQVSLEW